MVVHTNHYGQLKILDLDLMTDIPSEMESVGHIDLHAQLIKILGKKTQTINHKFYHIFKATSNWV